MYSTKDDAPLQVQIEHHRDVIAFGGKVEQDYRFLKYSFAHSAGNVIARAYLDDIWEVSILEPQAIAAIPDDVLEYLKRRFNVIKQLGGPEGYTLIWKKSL